MYLDHFGLSREPFHITPDPYFFYLSPSHKESLASLIYGLKNRKGFVALTGEVGLGKTTVIRAFLNRWSSKAKIKTVFIFNSNLSFKGLLLTIFSELGLQLPAGQQAENGQAASSEQDQIFELVQTLHSALIQEFEQGCNVILVIDEAQNMPLKTLENLRMLSNLETSRDKLLQIFLIGQTELDKILDRKELRQLRQRIAIRASLRPLTRRQSKDYILHRLQKSGAKEKQIFTRGALRRICKYARGVPRKINILADNALITGFGYGSSKINSRIIKEVQADLQGKRPKKGWKIALASGVLLGMLGTVIWMSPYRTNLLAGLQDISPWELTENMLQHTEDTQETAAGPTPEIIPETAQTKLQLEFQPLPVQTSTELQQTKEQQDKLAAAAQKQGQESEAEQEKVEHKQFEKPPAQEPTALPLPESELSPENIFIHYKLEESIPAYSGLSQARQLVLVRMARQTSINGLLTFERMLAALEQGNFEEAARQMVLSRWARSVGDEAEALAEAMRKDELGTE